MYNLNKAHSLQTLTLYAFDPATSLDLLFDCDMFHLSFEWKKEPATAGNNCAVVSQLSQQRVAKLAVGAPKTLLVLPHSPNGARRHSRQSVSLERVISDSGPL